MKEKCDLKLASQFVTGLQTLLFLFRGHQELVHENNNRKGFIDHKRGVEFSKKKRKKPQWTVYFRFPLKTNGRLFLVTCHCQSESLKLGDRGDIYIYIPALTPCVG